MDNKESAVLEKGSRALNIESYSEALSEFKIAYKIATAKCMNQETIKQCMFNLGTAHLVIKKSVEGIDVLQNLEKQGYDKQLIGDLYYNLGIGFELEGSLMKAINYFEKSLTESCVKNRFSVFCRLGRLYYTVKDFEHASRAYETASSEYVKSGDQSEQRVIAMYHQAVCLEKLKTKPGEMLRVAGDCKSLCKSVMDVGLSCKLYNELGLLYTQCGQYQDAEDCFKLALTPVEKDKRTEAVVNQNLGAIYNCLGRYEEAIKTFELAATAHASVGCRNGQGQCFNNIAYSYSKMKKFENAGEFYQHALQAAKDSSDNRGKWQAYEGLGAVAFRRNKLNKAEEYYRKALTTLSTSEEENSQVQDRIVGKLRDVIKCQQENKNEIHPDKQASMVPAKETKPREETVLVNSPATIPIVTVEVAEEEDNPPLDLNATDEIDNGQVNEFEAVMAQRVAEEEEEAGKQDEGEEDSSSNDDDSSDSDEDNDDPKRTPSSPPNMTVRGCETYINHGQTENLQTKTLINPDYATIEFKNSVGVNKDARSATPETPPPLPLRKKKDSPPPVPPRGKQESNLQIHTEPATDGNQRVPNANEPSPSQSNDNSQNKPEPNDTGADDIRIPRNEVPQKSGLCIIS